MLSQITTKSFNVYLNNDVIVSAKCRTTGRFVKRVIAQLELNAELKARSELNNRISKIKKAQKKETIKMLRDNVEKEYQKKSFKEKVKLALIPSVAKVAVLGVITLSAFNFA